ncbi:helix-turn-helix transcriptional regulator [Mesorhizobium sp. M0134]|uniref:ATP-binding protein n=1 Tax=Mesorhizobium sp. M0134 TaxID=2956889 RepID=UPI003337F262
MIMAPAVVPRQVISFGPFSLVIGERLLTKNGKPIELGARTFDTLAALLSHPNEVISKRDLMAKIWPDVTVDEGSLRFHIAAVRKTLDDGMSDARYIATVAGRGYSFIAPTSVSADMVGNSAKIALPFDVANFLPARLLGMVGREDGLLAVSNELATSRFVTIVGPGGVGKTTVAVAVAHELLEAFAGAVLFVDLGMLKDPEMVPGFLASLLGLAVQTSDPTLGVIAHLRDKRILLVLDNCEHVIEATATLAARIFLAAPQVHILATSREGLRVDGEQVHRLSSLAFPPEDPQLTAATALTFPAIQLFVDRVAAGGARLDLSDSEAAIVASICRRLDGMSLAIELAAGRVAGYGLQQTAQLLDQHLTLLWPGKRTAPPRQKTLRATLDWSFELLPELERLVLRRLAVFVGHFNLEAARAIVTSETVDEAMVLIAIDSLVSKSMVAITLVGTMVRYRLLDVTRTYALEIKIDDTELRDLAARHAIYYQQLLERTGADWQSRTNTPEGTSNLSDLNNVRVALEWCFGVGGDSVIGCQLASAAAPVFLGMSLLAECHRWCERAIFALDSSKRAGGKEEMHLQAALGTSLMYTTGNNDAAELALSRSLTIAEGLGDKLNRLRLLGMLYSFRLRVGDFKTNLQYAERVSILSETIADPAAAALADSLLGTSHHFKGSLRDARTALEAAIRHSEDALPRTPEYPGFDLRSWDDWASLTLARTLWLQGQPSPAMDLARKTVRDTVRMAHPVRISVSLTWALSVFLWNGDLDVAEEYTDWLIAQAESHSLTPYLAVGRGYKGELALRRGDSKGGVENIKKCLEEFQATHYRVLTTPFRISLVQGLVAMNRSEESLKVLDDTIGLVDANGDLLYMPELLRLKGTILITMPQPQQNETERYLTESLKLSRSQGALAWELRTATDLAGLWARRGSRDAALKLLRPVYGQFADGFVTADLKVAERLLKSLA